MACGSMNAAKEKGLVRSEGKEYVMKDGDVVLFQVLMYNDQGSIYNKTNCLLCRHLFYMGSVLTDNCK